MPENPKIIKKAELKSKKNLSVSDALKYVKENNMSPKEAFEFLKKSSPKALMVINPDRWEMEKKDPNFKPPITKEEIDSYNEFLSKMEGIKTKSDTKDIEEYLAKSGFEAPKTKASGVLSGASIVANAKAKGVKVIPNDDGSFEIFDDENVFTDTDKGYGKGRKIYPNVKYEKSTYRKGNDLVNVYKVNTLPTYDKRIPQPKEIEDFTSGKYYTQAATPEMKKYYADVYFDPANPTSSESTFYGPQVNKEDIDRFAYARKLGEDIKPFYSEWSKENIKNVHKRGRSGPDYKHPTLNSFQH
jgi:hypothetical protein